MISISPNSVACCCRQAAGKPVLTTFLPFGSLDFIPPLRLKTHTESSPLHRTSVLRCRHQSQALPFDLIPRALHLAPSDWTLVTGGYSMSKRYSPDYKRLVLKLLRYNHSKLTDIARFAGVPERTLRDWQRNEQEAAALRRQSAAAAPPPPQRRFPPS
jgi:hypothetical protein